MVNPMDVVNVLKSITLSKPLLPVILPLPEFWEKIKNESGMPPILKTPEIAADITANLLQLSNKPDSKDRLKPQKEKMPPGVSAGFLLPADAHNLALKYRLPIINEIIVEPNRLETEAGSFFYPAVLKGISSAFSHKSDIGGVKVNLHNKNMLLEASDQMRAAFEKRNAALDAFLIQPYLTAAYELLLGGFRDPSFGPVIMFGTGGKYVEFFNDTAIRSAKLTDNDIISMIEETNAGTILKGVRGEKGADMNALKAIIRNAAILLLNNEWIEEFDCNPLIYTQSGEFAIVDIRIKAGG
jgi:acyl-CoA synthetase (NDP forming)